MGAVWLPDENKRATSEADCETRAGARGGGRLDELRPSRGNGKVPPNGYRAEFGASGAFDERGRAHAAADAHRDDAVAAAAAARARAGW